MKSKVKSKQDYQGGHEGAQQQGGGVSRQSGARGSASIARHEYQGGTPDKRDDSRRGREETHQDTQRSVSRSGSRGH